MVKTPIEKAKYIEDNFRKYIKSTNSLPSELYGPLLKDEIDKQELLKGPYLSKTLEFQSGLTLEEMSHELDDNGRPLVNPEILNLGCDEEQKKKLKYRLRSHQEVAIRRVHDGHNLIVTTGTGSGKTESFLYPIINEILNDPNIDRPGIRAIFLFPMNALVNDQFDRVRKLVKNYKRIRYGFYTGATLHGTKREDTEGNGTVSSFTEQPDVELEENEMITREAIRNNPPHILFTNYSMLEYLLLRPTDDSLLNETNTQYWRFVVLDEAHVYKGALAIEVGMLLRRLQARINRSLQFILTSATLGTEDDEGIQQIKNFGKGLTSKDFEKDDILFSRRIPLISSNARFSIEPEDYSIIYSDFTEDIINKMLGKYNVISDSDDINGKLYDLFFFDEHLYEIDSFIQNTSVEFKNLQEHMDGLGFDEYNLANFIDLICRCKKNGKKLLDLKYHSFIRSLSGAFVTLGENPQLTLNRYTKSDDGRAFFEIGSCRRCNTTYLIGVLKKNSNDIETLYQNGAIDIYADYQEGEKINVDYFITEDEIIRQGIEESEKLIKYELCPICGRMVLVNDNMDPFRCEHDCDKVIVYKVENNDQNKRNNLCTCPCCKSTNKKGMIKTINMGRDSSTALISQIYFEALEHDENSDDNKENVEFNWDFLNDHNLEKKQYSKQILAFSDSRQQASYAVVFAENNHHRLLRKRLIVEALNKNNGRAIDFSSLLGILKSMIDNLDLFDTKTADDNGKMVDSLKQAEITMLFEILKVDGIYSGEGLGLYYFNYEDEIVNRLINDAQFTTIFRETGGLTEEYTLKKEEFVGILEMIMNVFRTTPAVYSEDTLSDEDKERYFRFRQYQNSIQFTHMNNDDELYNSIRGLVSSDVRENSRRMTKLEKYTMKVLGCTRNYADKVLETIWKIITRIPNYLHQVNSERNTYQIYANKHVLHFYKDTTWYLCRRCKRITRINVSGICPNCCEQGSLESIDPDVFFEDNVYRNQYLHKKIEKLVYKEHTGQISNIAGRNRQDLFKAGKINYLSSSTTFEMGIDIGDLENVFMRNVPPSPSNYIQRAGRAGRGENSSAFILTYCSSNSHDYTFFLNPQDMINGICHTPVFKMMNAKIVSRHLLATAFSRFFIENPQYYTTIGEFYDNGVLSIFKEWLQRKDDDLIAETNMILSSTELNGFENGLWIENLFDSSFGLEEKMEIAQTKYLDAIAEIERSRSLANSSLIDARIAKYKSSQDLIGNLVDSGLLPKYGFPTDVIEMKVIDDNGSSKYKLTRDMKIAISEYAPSYEIMVDKKIYVSSYINRITDLFANKYYACKCSQCQKVVVHNTRTYQEICNSCGESNNFADVIPYLRPKYGFIAKKRESNEDTLPKKSYSSPVKYVGNGQPDGENLTLGNIIEISSYKNDELLVINEDHFYTCELCGYTTVINEDSLNPNQTRKHRNALGRGCENERLHRIKLGYLYKTDVLKIRFNRALGQFSSRITTLYALLEGIALAFGIERTDIDGLYIRDEGRDTFVLFDTVPGGAGHVKRLLNEQEFKNALQFALETLRKPCCDTACYQCLKNYYNQSYHKHLNKNKAVGVIDRIIQEIENPQTEENQMTPNFFEGDIQNTGTFIWRTFDLIGEDFDEEKYEIKDKISNYLRDNNINCSNYTTNPRIVYNDFEYLGVFYFQDYKLFLGDDLPEEIKEYYRNNTDIKIIDLNDGFEAIRVVLEEIF